MNKKVENNRGKKERSRTYIVLDTETTGLEYIKNDRVIDIGCVKIENFEVVDSYQVYLNPDGTAISKKSTEIHGITEEDLRDKPLFSKIADEFLDFIGDYPLVIHNAAFDMAFLNYELNRIKRKSLQNEVVDTLILTRKKFPKIRHNLNDLCTHFSIDISQRIKHGALLDAQLLAKLFIKLMREFILDEEDIYIRELYNSFRLKDSVPISNILSRRGQNKANENPVIRTPSQAEQEAHLKFIKEQIRRV